MSPKFPSGSSVTPNIQHGGIVLPVENRTVYSELGTPTCLRLRCPTRLYPRAPSVPHCHWLDHVFRQDRRQHRTVPVHRHRLWRWCGPVRWGQRLVEWPSILEPFDTAAKTTGPHTSWEKTKIQNVASRPSSLSCVISGVEAVNRFTYLGSDVDSWATVHQKFSGGSA